MLDVRVAGSRPLRFADGTAVRAASAVARLGDGWLVAQDDATAGAWLPSREATAARRLRLLLPVAGADVFSEAAGTKRSKPDLEAAVELPAALGGGVLLFGSGSLANRQHGVLVTLGGGRGPTVLARDLAPLYLRVGSTLELAPADLNLEGACVVGDRLRWFQRGHHRAGVPSASVDLDLAALVAAVRGDGDVAAVAVEQPRRYDLGDVDGVTLAITDAAALADGRVVVSASAEDSADAIADGRVTGSALAVLDDTDVTAVAALPTPDVLKLEGIAVVAGDEHRVELLGVVDQDDPTEPSLALDLALTWR